MASHVQVCASYLFHVQQNANALKHALASNALIDRVKALENSTDHLHIQICEVYDVLGLKADECKRSYSSERSQIEAGLGHGPREEWALRWLLKRFKATEVSHHSLSASHKAWVLLRILINCLSVRTSARLLCGHDFITALGNTLHWIATASKKPDAGPKLGQSFAERIVSSGDSATPSSVEFGSSDKSSRKRKREDNDSSYPKFPARAKKKFTELYSSICSVLNQIEAMTGGVSESNQVFAVEQLKASVRSQPIKAAHALGDCFSFIQYTLLNHDTKYESDPYDSFLHPALFLWESRSIPVEDEGSNEEAVSNLGELRGMLTMRSARSAVFAWFQQ